MSSRNIAVQRATFDRLLREKRAGESFTDLLQRLLDQKGGVEDLAGGWGRAAGRWEKAALTGMRTARRSR